MAKTTPGKPGRKVNKSEAIREMLKTYPKAKSKDIVSKLAGKGIAVKPTLVYFIKSKQKYKRRRAKRELVGALSRRTGSSNPADLVIKVKTLALDAGGIRNLKELVDALAD
jgi:hypothetical protein